MPLTKDELDDLIAILRTASQAEIMPRFARLDPADVKVKSHASDFVTVADEAAERAIEAAARARFGDVLFVGEEIMERDPTVIDGLATAARAVVVDPIDGTFNFANGIPAFAVIAAIVENGETVAGAVYDPVRDDTVAALAGEGAWMVAADGRRTRLQVAAPRPIGEMHGVVSWSYADEPVRSRMLRGMAGLWGAYNYRCGGQEFRLLATGGAHFGYQHKLTPWDHAAGELIHREAGGFAAHADGTPYKAHHRTGGLLLAPDADSWREIRDLLFD
jgi:fructose-1,6-bisphosphatase/inositol monophosphatase family enzyme